MSDEYDSLRRAIKVAETRYWQADVALDAALQVAAPTERKAGSDAYDCWQQAEADLGTALIRACPFKIGEVYRCRSGVVVTVVSHSVNTSLELVMTQGNVHKKNGKVGERRIVLWKQEWAGAVKLETEVAA